VPRADVVVDVSNSPSFEAPRYSSFSKHRPVTSSTRRQRPAWGTVALSVVGTDRVAGSGYLSAKTAREAHQELVDAILYTIVHATQFFEFAVRWPTRRVRAIRCGFLRC
jgi:hypothetical protein